MADRRQSTRRAVLAAGLLAGLSISATADQFGWVPRCDFVWQSCCDGPDNTKVNNWGRESPAPVCPALPTGSDDVLIIGDCEVGPSPLPSVAALTIQQSDGVFVLNHGLGIGQEATFEGPFVWNQGEIGRAGGASGQFASLNGGLSIVGDVNKTLGNFGGFRLINNGVGSWSGAGNLTIGMIPGGCCPAILENAAGATFTVENDAPILQVAFGVGRIENAGTLIKANSSGTSEWAVNVDNTGLVHVQSGELRLTRAGVIGGSWIIDPGAQLSFAGNFFELDPSVTIQGRAVVTMSGSNIGMYVNDDVTIDDLTIAGDGRLGGTGVLRVAGTLSVEGGNANVHINVLPAGRIESSGVAQAYGQVDLEGQARVVGGASMGCFNQFLNILPGGELVLENGAVYNQTGLVSKPIESEGLIRKVAGAGTARVANFFSQNLNLHPGSSVECPEGELRIENRVESMGGNFNTGPDAEIGIYGWSTFRAGTTVTGDGWLRVEAQNTSVEAGFELVVPRLRITGDASRGINGPGTLRITDELRVEGGFVTAPTTIEPDAVLEVVGPAITGGNSNIDNFGILTASAGGLRFASLTNHAGGVIDMRDDVVYGFANGATPITNAGIIIKDAGSGDATLGGYVTNNDGGLIEVRSGQLVTTRLFQNGGLTWLNGGAINTTSLVSLTGGVLKGDGSIVTNNTVTNSGGSVEPGASTGILTITGAYRNEAVGTLRIEIAGTAPGTQHDVLAVGGNVTLSGGTLELKALDGYVPQDTDTFTVLTAGNLTGSFSSVVLRGFPPRTTAEVTYNRGANGSVVVRFGQNPAGQSGSTPGTAPAPAIRRAPAP